MLDERFVIVGALIGIAGQTSYLRDTVAGRVQPQIPWNFQRKLCDWIAPTDVTVK